MRDIASHAIERVASSFDTKTLERGLRYAMEGRVQLTRSEWPAVAQVHGAESYVVTVYYNAASEHIRGECSCPVADDCKHAAATALTVFQDQHDDGDSRYQEFRAHAVGEWLSSLGRDAGEVQSDGQRESRRVLAFVIEKFRGEVSLGLYRTTEKKRGGFSKASKMHSWAHTGGAAPSWMSRDDIRLMSVVSALGANSFRSEYLLNGFDELTLKELANTGRLFYQEVSDRPLRWGAERASKLGWQATEDDPDDFCLALPDELVLLAAQTNVYIDVEHGFIGPIEIGLPTAISRKLVEGPPVPRFMRKTAEKSLRSLVGDTYAAAFLDSADSHKERETEEGRADVLTPKVVIEYVNMPNVQEIEYQGWATYGDNIFPLGKWRDQKPTEIDLMRNMAEEGRLEDRLSEVFRKTPNLPYNPGRQEVLRALQYVAHLAVPALRSEGWTVEFEEDFPVEPAIDELSFVEELTPVDTHHNWFGLGLGVSVSGRRVELLPLLLEAIKDGRIDFSEGRFGAVQPLGINLKLPTGELIYVPKDRLDRWIRPLTELRLRGLNKDQQLLMPGVAAADIAVGDSELFAQSGALDEIRDSLAQLVHLEERQEGKDFCGELRGYQRKGHGWLRFLHDKGYGGLLCDDMGLGKTIQVLAFADGLRASRKLKVSSPILVVAPRSVVGNWHAEAGRFTPKLKSCVHLGPKRARTVEELCRYHLVVTSYQTLLRDIALFTEAPWTSLILDEAQAVKTPSTKLRRAVTQLRAHSRICVSGTPIENRLLELWSLIDIAMPGVFGDKRTFHTVFQRPIEKYANGETLELLQRRLRPFMLRRRKSEVDVDLPPKTTIVEKVGLDTAQRDLYESLRLILDKKVRDALEKRGVQASTMIILDALLRLRQCCCDPRLLNLPEARKVKRSAKLERLMSMLDELADAERSVLVFSQFTTMLDLIAAECDRLGLPYLMLTGSTRNRESVVARFQSGEVPIFLISLKAGGVGLNLTRADTVIHYDPWWNPAAENQATDRAHRIGQEKNVLVYKLVAEKTLEEEICDMQDKKQHLTDAALHEGGITHFGAEDLEALFRRL